MMDYPYSNTRTTQLFFRPRFRKKAKNLNVPLCAFEKLSCLKINFHKSEMYCFGEALGKQVQKAKNLKVSLCAFEKLSGLKINFHKSEMYCFGEALGLQEQYTTIFGCQGGLFPFKYLDIPMHYRKLSNKDWKMVEERIEKRLSS
jgi:hypothetical protein